MEDENGNFKGGGMELIFATGHDSLRHIPFTDATIISFMTSILLIPQSDVI